MLPRSPKSIVEDYKKIIDELWSMTKEDVASIPLFAYEQLEVIAGNLHNKGKTLLKNKTDSRVLAHVAVLAQDCATLLFVNRRLYPVITSKLLTGLGMWIPHDLHVQYKDRQAVVHPVKACRLNKVQSKDDRLDFLFSALTPEEVWAYRIEMRGKREAEAEHCLQVSMYDSETKQQRNVNLNDYSFSDLRFLSSDVPISATLLDDLVASKQNFRGYLDERAIIGGMNASPELNEWGVKMFLTDQASSYLRAALRAALAVTDHYTETMVKETPRFTTSKGKPYLRFSQGWLIQYEGFKHYIGPSPAFSAKLRDVKKFVARSSIDTIINAIKCPLHIRAGLLDIPVIVRYNG